MSLNKDKYFCLKQKSQILARFIHILEKKSIGMNFQYMNTFTKIKRTISQKDFKSIIQEEKSESDHQISLTKVRSSYLIQHVLDLKAKSIIEEVNVVQYDIWKHKMNNLIFLERKDKQKKLSLQEKKVEKKSQEESNYETCLFGALIFIILSFIYIIVKELKI